MKKKPDSKTHNLRGLMLRIDQQADLEVIDDASMVSVARHIRGAVNALLPRGMSLTISLITDHPQPKLQLAPPQRSQLLIDRTQNKVLFDGESVRLTEKEMQVLTFLVDRSPLVASRQEIMAQGWGTTGNNPGPRAIDVHIRRIRIKLGRFSHLVKAASGHGYYFE